jgi:hypothetical protein
MSLEGDFRKKRIEGEIYFDFYSAIQSISAQASSEKEKLTIYLQPHHI